MSSGRWHVLNPHPDTDPGQSGVRIHLGPGDGEWFQVLYFRCTLRPSGTSYSNIRLVILLLANKEEIFECSLITRGGNYYSCIQLHLQGCSFDFNSLKTCKKCKKGLVGSDKWRKKFCLGCEPLLSTFTVVEPVIIRVTSMPSVPVVVIFFLAFGSTKCFDYNLKFD